MIVKRNSKMKVKAKVPARGSGKAFPFKKIDPDKLRKRGERQGGNFDTIFKGGVDTYRPKQGDNCFRILPPTWPDADHFGYIVWVHGWIGGTGGSYLCPLKMKNKKCPICAEAQKARKAGEIDEAKALTPKEQYLYYVLDRNEDDDVPKVYQASWSLDREISARCQDRTSGKTLYIYHPYEGYDIFVRRTGEKLNTRYIALEVAREPSSISDDEKVMESIQETLEAAPIPSLLVYKNEDYLKNVLEGTAKDKDEDLDDEDEIGEEEDQEETETEEGDEESTTDEENDDETAETEDEEDENGEEETDADGEEESDENEEETEDEDDEEEEEEKPRVKRKPAKPVPRRREREERATRSRR